MPVIVGTPGDDDLTGTPGDDLLQGLGGNDRLNGGAGADTMEGGPGNDIYFVDLASDVVRELANEGQDYVYTSVSYALAEGSHVEYLATTATGSTAALSLYGNEFANTIVANDGNNFVSGGAGDDFIMAFGGDDIIDGGTGADVMEGGTGNDIYYADSVSDIVRESIGGGFDYVYTSTTLALPNGSEVEFLATRATLSTEGLALYGNEFANTIIANYGNNGLYGGASDDFLAGLDGDDILDGGTGADVMEGGDGNDIYFVDSGGDVVRDTSGTDLVFTSVTYALPAGAAIELLGTTNEFSTEGLALFGNEFANTIIANNGNNGLYGGAGNDFLSALGGDDILDGGTGADVMEGGHGNDIYFVDNAGDVIREASGYDLVFTSVSYALAAGAAIELLGTTNEFSLDALTLYGNEFANTITGNNGNNGLYGGDGNDFLSGLLGNDILDGGAGADVLEGGHGDDIYYVDQQGDVVRDSSGFDIVYTSASYGLANGATIEVLQASDLFSTTALNLYGNEFANTIVGNNGANLLVGGAGADRLEGNGGNDTLDGGADQDVLVGGAGADIFRFSAASDSAVGFADTIADFQTGIDRIDLSLIDANSQTINRDSFLFIGAQGFTGRAGELRYVQSGSTFDLYGDLNGDSVADLHIRVVGNGLVVGDINGAVAAPPANRPPAISSGTAASVAENSAASTIVYQTVASDPDGDPVTYRLSGPDAGLFSIDSSGAVRLLSPADYEARSSYAFTVVAEDGRGGAASQPVTLSIQNVNEAPVISSGTAATIPENSPTSTVVYQVVASDPDGNPLSYSLSGTDAAFFTIDANGAVRFIQSPDYETRSSYSFSVNASDGSLAATRGVTVTVTDVNESVGSTPIINETSAANDSIAQAQVILRSQLAVASNPNLGDQTLPSVQINGTISPLGDSDYFSITLQAGELLILDVDGTVSLDSFLKVFGPDGTLIAQNDDAVSFDAGSTAHSGVSHNMDSLVRFRAPTSGTYTFQIRSYEDAGTATSSGAYTINLSIGPQASQAVIDQENIDALISGSRWNTSTITYGFTTDPTQYAGSEGSPEKTNNFETLNPVQRAASVTAFALITQYTGLAFTENVASPGLAQIRMAQSDEPDTAYAYYPGVGDGGDAWFRNSAPVNSPQSPPRYDNPVAGNYGYLTFLHELGHAMGLKHGHESPALSPDRDSMEFSIMTYRGYIGADYEGTGYKNETWGFAQSFMMYDIAALQKIYGANYATQAGDSTYSWNPTTGAFSINGVVQWTPGGNRVFQTVWDGGGTDTYNLSGYSSPVTIDLRPGEWTTTSSVQLANLGGNASPLYARGNVANALLFNGDTRSLIENAVGGSGNDTIIANQASNRLTGGAGSDTFAWRSIGDAQMSNPDRILDFVRGADKIDLSGIDAIIGSPADDAFTFIGSNAFTGVAGQLRFDVDANGVNIYGDVDGNGIADLHIIVNGTSIGTADFIF